jgi:cyanophycin synthetase
VTTHPLDDFLRDHVQRGGALVALESTRLKPSITASFEGTSVQILRYEELRCVVQRGRPDLIYDALFAAAIALGMGLSVAQVSDALRSFDTDRGDAAPSFEVVDWNGITCLLSAGHDPEAVARTCELAAPLQISGRRTVVQVGRFFVQNHATAKIGAALAGRFGRYICLEESGGTSGRAAPRDSLPSALIERGVAPAAVMTCDSEASAIDAALQAALAGDTILVLTDNFAATRQHISRTVAIETEGEADPPVNAGVG